MTIREIARLANVSPATISLVLNNKPGVGDETRKRVQNILKEYDYKL
ncbi:MAG: LacI family DNA-binding transcriptional regulator, partial [Christensenella sp.]